MYDGDSLTFPLLWKALVHGEPLHPIMSSQLLVFPEGVAGAFELRADTPTGPLVARGRFIAQRIQYAHLGCV